MARIVTYTMVMVGLLLFMNMAGLPTASGGFLAALANGNISLIFSSTFYITAAAILLLSIGGIAIGIFTKQSAESYIVMPMASFLLLLTCNDFIAMYSYFNGAAFTGQAWVGNLVLLILLPLLAGYFISIVQWWRGNDI
jgi:hypothetical protein